MAGIESGLFRKIRMKPFLSVLLFCTLLWAGDEGRIVHTFPLHVPSLNMDSYHSLGFSDMLSAEPADLASSNPATVNNFTCQHVGISFSYTSKIHLSRGISLTAPMPWLPSAVGYVFPLGNFRFALTYHRKYAQFIDYGKTELSTIEHPEGTGEFIHPTSSKTVHSVSMIIGYSFQHIFTGDDRLSFGLQTYVDYLDWKDKIGFITGTSYAFGWSGKWGLMYEMNRRIGFGLFYEKGTDIKSRLKLDPPLHPIGSADIYQLQLADKLAFGLRLRPAQNFTFGASFCGILWNWKESNPYEDQLDMSLSVIYTVPRWFDISFGLYSTRSKTKSYDSKEKEATYLNVGLRRQFGSTSLQIELFDSSHTADTFYRHTILRLGFNQTLFPKQ